MTEWTELKTLQEVAIAQSKDWEIEYRMLYGPWAKWCESSWQEANTYRGRPRQPKMKKVKMLCWFDGFGLFWRKEAMNYDKQWIRVPAQDIEIEIPEES